MMFCKVTCQVFRSLLEPLSHQSTAQMFCVYLICNPHIHHLWSSKYVFSQCYSQWCLLLFCYNALELKTQLLLSIIRWIIFVFFLFVNDAQHSASAADATANFVIPHKYHEYISIQQNWFSMNYTQATLFFGMTRNQTFSFVDVAK